MGSHQSHVDTNVCDSPRKCSVVRFAKVSQACQRQLDRSAHLVSALSHLALKSARYAFGTSDGPYPVMLIPHAQAVVV